MKRLILILLSFYSCQVLACYDARITSPTPFMGNNGEIFKLSDGSIWEVKSEYEYLYEYYPTITACPEHGFIVIGGKKLTAVKITTGSAPSTNANVIESRIDGDSEGFEGDTIFKLRNGQIWQQIDGRYKYKYKYAPKVIIVLMGMARGKMTIEGISTSILVERLK